MKEKERIVFIGGGGHARVLINLIQEIDEYEITGIVDPGLETGSEVFTVPVLGSDDALPDVIAGGIKTACIAIGSIKDNSRRRELYMMVKNLGLSVPSLIHPRAVVSRLGSFIGEGVHVMAGAIIQPGTSIGENTIVNTGAVIEHDCIVGDNVHVCPGAVICGGSIIGDNSFIGAGATIIQSLEIGRDAVVGAGAVIYRNLSDGTLARSSR
jgi:sugar O-acyltransferase (sialic acid O-acetyltransferase NeuD family)